MFAARDLQHVYHADKIYFTETSPKTTHLLVNMAMVQLEEDRVNKINELCQLLNDPLLSFSDVVKPSFKHPASFQSIIGESDETVKHFINKQIEIALHRPKRKASEDQDFVKRRDTASFKLLSTNKQQNEFLNKDIRDLEVLSVPENYPTKPHTVSSLAELYYLTQTLPLNKLLPGPHKVLMTDNYESALLEGKIAVLYSRIEELKRQGKWSLRQPLKFYDPFVYIKKNKKHPVHGTLLLQEAKWLAADFKETAKFKKACCVHIAQAVQDYWTYGDVMCVKRKPIVHLPIQTEQTDQSSDTPAEIKNDPDEMEIDSVQNEAEKEPEDIKVDVAEDIVDPIKQDGPPEATAELRDEVQVKVEQSDPPTIDTKLLLEPGSQQEDFVPTFPTFTEPKEGHTGPFKLHVNMDDLKKIDQSIIKNLPKFTAFDEQETSANLSESPMAAVSRLIHPFDTEDEWYKIVVKDAESLKAKKSKGPPEYQKGLFGFQSHRRFNFLKPPKPPAIKNIEYRSPTIWLPKDDKYLIHYIAEFCFNWDLISECLSATTASMKKYESNIERRTPWQCFERYIQLNEKFQFSDMRGTYAYHAQQWLEQAHKTQLTTKRRISPLGVGTESIQRGHRKLRWASMFDAMRKSMKKREIAQSKLNYRRTTNSEYTNQTNSSSNGTSSAPGSNTPNATPVSNGNGGVNSPQFNGTKRSTEPVATPGELSKLKYENDKSSRKAYNDQAATRYRMMAAVAQQKQQSPSAMSQSSSGSGTISSQHPGSNANASVPIDKANVQANRGSKPMQLGQIPVNKIPTNPNGTPYTPEQLQQLLQLQKQKRLMQQKQQMNASQIPPNSSNPKLVPGSSGSKPVGNVANPGQSNQVPRQNPGAQPNNASKPRIHFAPAQVSAIINSIQTKNPSLSKDQVTKLAATYLANLQQQQQNRLNQNRMNLQQLQQNSNAQTSQGALQPAQMMQQRSNSQNYRSAPQGQLKQGQVANLTAQERSQLQMLKATRTAQQQLQQQQLQQQMLRQQSSPQLQMLYPEASPLMDDLTTLQGVGNMSPNSSTSNLQSSQGSASDTPNSRNSNT